jgi:hypothetical protein
VGAGPLPPEVDVSVLEVSELPGLSEESLLSPPLAGIPVESGLRLAEVVCV